MQDNTSSTFLNELVGLLSTRVGATLIGVLMMAIVSIFLYFNDAKNETVETSKDQLNKCEVVLAEQRKEISLKDSIIIKLSVSLAEFNLLNKLDKK